MIHFYFLVRFYIKTPIKAKENVNFYKVSDKVKLVNAEGLNSYTEGINTITISGMGGLNINKILDDNKERTILVKQL